MDTISKDERSKLMAKIKSKGSRSTEGKFRASLASNGIRGWKMNSKNIAGCPDFAFEEAKIAVFIDGCFWHGCPACCRMPSSNKKYWREKIAQNIQRDRSISRTLRKQGWVVIRFWEHQMKKSATKCTEKVIKQLRP